VSEADAALLVVVDSAIDKFVNLKPARHLASKFRQRCSLAATR
jgi:hypothetical protein